jgi:hypothetical protein
MKRYLCAVLFLALASAADAADQESVAIGRYISDLARQNQIAVEGLSVVGGDTFTPFRKPVSVDKALARALGRYNYIVNYENQRIVRVVILGRKGNSVGDLPAEEPPAMPTPSTGNRDDEDEEE